jgi:hypothetical protein
MTFTPGRRSTALLVGVVVAAGYMLVSIVRPEPARSAGRANINAYRGLATWVDIWDSDQWDHPWEAVRSMKRRGIRTIFLETGNYHSDGALFRPTVESRFIHDAHRRNMRVIAWYLPSFANMHRDFHRAMAAIRFRTRSGDSFDSFGLDIESPIVKPLSERKDRMLRLSRRIRNAAGNFYPLSGIIPSPYGMKRELWYWGRPAHFPYAKLAKIDDVLAPMSYYTNRTSGMRQAHDYTEFNIRFIRKHSDNPELPLHPIGGIASLSSRDETRGFVRALREHGVLGGSLYDFATSTREDWAELRHIPANPEQSPALPVKLGTSAYLGPIGNVPGADRSHPKEVFFESGGRAGQQRLTFEVFDVQRRELRVKVNWQTVAGIAPTTQDSWSDLRLITIPDRFFKDRGANLISLVARGAYPRWHTWGVRDVLLQPSPQV